MHELPVTESILEIALRHAQAAQAARVTDIYLVIGQLASIVDDSVQFYWDMISADTIAAGAQLHFKRIPAEMLCLDCGKGYQPGEGELACPVCGGRHVKVVSGEEFRMEAIEVESAEEVRAREEREQG
ncbi:MAG: hydrogenase maturation nickel metallochaperone HypA [Anaerolineales bacterium]|jgi:hydrogenase nickel incorporation protein HypA/HybF